MRRTDDGRSAARSRHGPNRPDGIAAVVDPSGLADRVLFRDDHVIVIDKPAGLPVHAGPKGGVTLEDGLDALRGDNPWRPELAHRLDRETSGCLVLGRDRKTLARLGRIFVGGRAEKVYWAVVEGSPAENEGRISLALSKISKKRGWHMRVDPKGKPAITRYRVLGRAERFAWLELQPKTGRTHQLRVHCAARGWPILGDGVYGRGRAAGPRLHLHARAIAIPLYPDRKPILVEAPVPADMQDALEMCGWRNA